MGKITKFQAIVAGILAISVVIATFLFASSGSSGGGGSEVVGTGGRVELWGTLDKRNVDTILSILSQEIDGFNVSYTQYDPLNFESVLIERLASGTGPDAIILPSDLLMRQFDKLSVLSYESYSERSFRDAYTEGSEIFLTSNGSFGLPIGVDPLVMYWNRNRFTNTSILEPPSDWETFFNFANVVTERTNTGDIIAPAVAFGEYKNVRNAKDVLVMLMMQAGNPLSAVRGVSGRVSTLKDGFGTKPIPAQAALVFYTDFGDPVKAIYSWNRSLPLDRDLFTRGDLAVYFGYASELATLRAQNPNLNFDVAVVPQPRAGGVRQTIGTFYSVVPLRSAKNGSGAFTTMVVLSGSRAAGLFSSFGVLQPVHRGLLATPPTDAFGSVFYSSAFIARTWYDPSPQASEQVFQRMIEDVVTGRAAVSTAISNAHASLNALY